MLDIVLRYYTIVQQINNSKLSKVLEVGSDDYGIAPFLDKSKKIVLFDVAFRRKNLKNVTYKTGSVLNMPFKDNSFDIVVSVDMLEHIPAKLRKKALSELICVTKHRLYLSFPADNPARERDKKVYQIFSKIPSYHLSRYINEHIENGLPESSEVVSFFKAHKVKDVNLIRNMNTKIEFPIVILSNLDFIPILLLQKILDPFKQDVLPFFFKTFMILFGWLSPIFSVGDCYRTLLIVTKQKSEE